VLAITDLEGNKSISNVFNEWSKLEKIYSDSSQSLIPPQTRNTIRGFLNQRWNLIQDNIIYAAYALDPRFRGQCLNMNVFSVTNKLIQNITGSNALISEFVKFRTSQYPFADVVTQYEDPVEYWQKLICVSETQHLAKLALKLIGFPQSSASVERTFSAVRRIHSWQRACIGREKLRKLVYIYVNRHALRGENMLR